MKKSLIIVLILLIVGGLAWLYFVTKPKVAKEEVIEVTEEMPKEKVLDFGDRTSQTLTVKAWEALTAKDYEAALAYTDECINLYEEEAIFQQSQLTDFAPKELAFDYWALNDVATCYFIRAEVYRQQGEIDKAKETYQTIVDKFGFAQCWDPQGWFWKVADGAKDKLTTLGTGYDFGDYTSQTLTTKAWGALNAKDYYAVELYTGKCIDLFEKNAIEQQASLSDYPDTKVDENNNGVIDVHEKYWALNDVGTCHFILGKALAEQGKQDEAKKHFDKIINELSYAQCWDPQGWFWKVQLGAKNEIDRFTAKRDYGDYTSMNLTVKAWNALGAKDYAAVEDYTQKCFDLYSAEAKKQQAQLTDYAPKESAFDWWALNDVGTCHFIRGEAYMNQKMWDKAEKEFQAILDEYNFSQCWDPKGWFWKPSVGARGRLNKIRVEKEMLVKEKGGVTSTKETPLEPKKETVTTQEAPVQEVPAETKVE